MIHLKCVATLRWESKCHETSGNLKQNFTVSFTTQRLDISRAVFVKNLQRKLLLSPTCLEYPVVNTSDD